MGAFGNSDLFSELRDAAGDLLKEPADADALDRFGRLYDSGAVSEALALIEEGILKGDYHRELDFSQGFALKLPHITEMVSLSRILAASVRLQTADGDHAGAWDTALTSLRLANVLEDEPLLISQLVRMASIDLAIDSIRSLDHSDAAPSHLAEIDTVTRAGLAVLEYQHQHGSYPTDLASLGRDDLRDPFNGEPLRYQSEDTGFTISSVGENLISDSATADSDDISWSYSGPPDARPESR